MKHLFVLLTLCLFTLFTSRRNARHRALAQKKQKIPAAPLGRPVSERRCVDSGTSNAHKDCQDRMSMPPHTQSN